MTKTELINLVESRFLHHAAGGTYGYSQGELQINAPDRPITDMEFRIDIGALKFAFVDAMTELGLTNGR